MGRYSKWVFLSRNRFSAANGAAAVRTYGAKLLAGSPEVAELLRDGISHTIVAGYLSADFVASCLSGAVEIRAVIAEAFAGLDGNREHCGCDEDKIQELHVGFGGCVGCEFVKSWEWLWRADVYRRKEYDAGG